MAITAVLLSVMLTAVVPRRKEHDAFAKLSQRILYAGVIYDGPQWNYRAFSDYWYFQRIWHIHLRLESTDIDRSEILKQLSELPHLEKIELVAGDPFPATQALLQDAIGEIESKLPNVNVTILP